MTAIEGEPCSESEGLSSFIFDDESGFLTTVQKSSELGVYYFGWLKDWIREALSTPFCLAGHALRDRLYFPMTHPDEGFQWNMNLGAHLRQMLVGNEPLVQSDAFPQLEEVRNAFEIKAVPIEVKSGDKTYTFQLYVVESKQQVDGKGLRLFLFSSYGNHVMDKNEKTDWKPETIFELGAVPVLLLKALREKGYEMDSLELFSLGAVAFEGLKYLDQSEADMIPKVVILDRAMPSTYKVAQKLYSFPFRQLLYGAAYSSNWDANPEAACLEFFGRVPSLEGRTLIQIEAVKDSYFSGPGAYDSDFLERLQNLGMTTYSGTFYAPCYKEASHHALSRSLLYNNPDSGTIIDRFIEMKPLETLSDALVRSVHLNTEHTRGPFHQSLIVGGNSENLDIVLLRSYSLLRSFLNQKED